MLVYLNFDNQAIALSVVEGYFKIKRDITLLSSLKAALRARSNRAQNAAFKELDS